MDNIGAALTHLRSERRRLNRVIQSLEILQSGPVRDPLRRGRKSMPEAEKKVVSMRMRKYWENRRKEKEG